jgi:flavin reductase (DIM6/NTAB) family NADH-FMN oxidoreductase RutF
MPPTSRERIGPALGKVTSGIYVATAAHDGARIGMLASFIEQAAFEPPMVSMAVGRERPILAALDGAGVFGINVLGKHNHPLVRSFVKPQDGDPFEGHALVANAHNVPQFADAMAFLICKVAGKVVAGDHWLYLAEVIDGALQHEHEHPMFRIRRNGFDY